MKTIDDLKALLPTLLDLFSNEDHQIGESHWDQDEDGWGKCNDYESNCFTYEEDGWCIEINYECCGEWDSDPGDYWNPPYCELRCAWGEVTEISAYHYDEDTDEEREFSEDELAEFFAPFDELLKDIA